MANERLMDERSTRILGASLRKRLQGRAPAYILDMLSDDELISKWHQHTRETAEWMAAQAKTVTA